MEALSGQPAEISAPLLLADLASLSRLGYPRPLDSRTVASSPHAPNRITSGQIFKVRPAWTKLPLGHWFVNYYNALELPGKAEMYDSLTCLVSVGLDSIFNIEV